MLKYCCDYVATCLKVKHNSCNIHICHYVKALFRLCSYVFKLTIFLFYFILLYFILLREFRITLYIYFFSPMVCDIVRILLDSYLFPSYSEWAAKAPSPKSSLRWNQHRVNCEFDGQVPGGKT